MVGGASAGGQSALGGVVGTGATPPGSGGSTAGTMGLGGDTSASGGAPSGGTSGGAPSGGAGAGESGVGGAQAGTGGSTAGAGAGGTAGPGGATGSDVIQALREYLAVARDAREPLPDQPFARTPLSASEASEARALLWDDHTAMVRATRQADLDDKEITLGSYVMRFDFSTFGAMPDTGRSLYLSLHGGGEADPSVNDEQWENQKGLYQPDEGIYLAPRAPTDTWNLWHQDHIDPMFDQLITDLIVLQNVDPNRVYVMGYSAGGDGVYQLGPRMGDYWAAAAMMAGHPNDAQPDSLRNTPFTIHVGGMDTAYDRNLIAEEWGTMLDDLQAQAPGGYVHEVEVHPDKGHWMDLEDAVAVPWMAAFTRDPVPDRVVWLQDDVVHTRFYWLSVDEDQASAGARVVASYEGQSVTIEATGVDRVQVRLSDAMLDLDQSVAVSWGGSSVFDGPVDRVIETLWQTIEERGDPALSFSAQVEVEAP